MTAPIGGDCRICGLPLEHVEHAIFGGSPTFHGFVATGLTKRTTCDGVTPRVHAQVGRVVCVMCGRPFAA